MGNPLLALISHYLAEMWGSKARSSSFFKKARDFISQPLGHLDGVMRPVLTNGS